MYGLENIAKLTLLTANVITNELLAALKLVKKELIIKKQKK